MAEKEATVYVVDVGVSMGHISYGRHQSDLDYAMTYIWDKIATTISTGRKTLCAGVLAFRSDETKNELSEDDSYENIYELKPIGQLLMQDLRELRKSIKISRTNAGDAISALVVAIQMISQFCKKLKYIRKVVMVTNGNGAMDLDSLSSIIDKIKSDHIELTILGVDFDDEEYGFKEESKEAAKVQNEATLKSLVDKCEGVYGTLKEAISELEIPHVKQFKPLASYKGLLTLGNQEQYGTSLRIDVERYPRVMLSKPPGASNVVTRSEAPSSNKTEDVTMIGAEETKDETKDEDLATVHNDKTYQVKDPSAPGGTLQVNRDDLARGYEYGRTAVPISELEENITKLETLAGLDIMGFIPIESFEQAMIMERTNIIVAMRANDKAFMALSSLIHALYEQRSAAVARLVTKEGKAPIIVLLCPSIEPDFECLIELELPFAEDVREYKFPPLDRIVTVSGKVVTEHRLLPAKGLQSAMDSYVDLMDVSSFGEDALEYASLEEAYSPMLHRINQAICFKAVHPNLSVPPPSTSITKFSHPPPVLVSSPATSTCLSSLKREADIKKVPPRLPFKKRGGDSSSRESDQPLSGLDVTALLFKRAFTNQHKITAENAIPEFRQLLDTADDISIVRDAVAQLSEIIRKWVTSSFGEAKYERVLEVLGVMRQECLEMEEPSLWNDFMTEFKKSVLAGELGGDRRELWWRVVRHRLGLIDKSIAPSSKVYVDQAMEFLSLR